MIATITSKGQVTLPAGIRNKLRLHAGDKLDFFIGDDNRIEAMVKKGSLKDLKEMIPSPRKGVTLAEMEKAVLHGVSKDAGN